MKERASLLYLWSTHDRWEVARGPGKNIREFKLRVIRQTANARQRKILRYQAIKSKWTCCFKTEIHNYSFDARKKIWNENVQRKFCQEISYLLFAVPGNVKLKLPIPRALWRHNCKSRDAVFYNILHFIVYYPTLTQLGFIFSFKQSCIRNF
jgi:hypothetical protein